MKNGFCLIQDAAEQRAIIKLLSWSIQLVYIVTKCYGTDITTQVTACPLPHWFQKKPVLTISRFCAAPVEEKIVYLCISWNLCSWLVKSKEMGAMFSFLALTKVNKRILHLLLSSLANKQIFIMLTLYPQTVCSLMFYVLMF